MLWPPRPRCSSRVPRVPIRSRRAASGQNVEAVGYSDLNGKPGFKMSIRKAGERWYLYIGMLWNEGWQIVDVTDPKDPKVVKEIEGPANTATDQMEIADGKMITALAKISPGWGGDPKKPFDEGVLIWDLKDPLNPREARPVQNQVARHPPQRLPGRQIHAPVGDHAGLSRQHLCDRRHL